MKATQTAIALIILFLVSISFDSQSLSAQSNDVYTVQVAAYGKRKSRKYFKDLGVDQIEEKIVLKTLFKYYSGSFTSLLEAEKYKNEIASKGFFFAQVINLSELVDLCATACNVSTPMTAVRIYSDDQIIKIRNVFFGFDSSFLTEEGRSDLDKLSQLLKENQQYKVEVHAHTDSRGSYEYNLQLSVRRVNSVVNYLSFKEVADRQIETYAHGEEKPIAFNEINGNDSKQGRSFNRRVELKVKDTNDLLDVVEDIIVPEKFRKIGQ